MREILRLFPWGIRNRGRYKTWLEKDDNGDLWRCYRFLEDCDCPGKNGEEKNFLSGRFRPSGVLRVHRRTFSSFWYGQSPYFNAELDEWGREQFIDCPMTVPRAMQAIVFRRIAHLMWDVVENGHVLDAEERFLVNQETRYAIQQKRKHASHKAQLDNS